jgi:hypothetical protein
MTSRTLDTGLNYRFNIHLDTADPLINMSLKDSDSLPEFDVAYDLMAVEFDKPERKMEAKELQYEYSPKIKFLIGLYREPLPVISTIILPLFLINIIILAITWVGGDDGTLLTNVTTILLVLVAYLPTVRAEIPSQPYFTMIDCIIVSLIVQCLVAISPVFITDKDVIEGNWRERGSLVASAVLFSLWVAYVIFKII